MWRNVVGNMTVYDIYVLYTVGFQYGKTTHNLVFCGKCYVAVWLMLLPVLVGNKRVYLRCHC